MAHLVANKSARFFIVTCILTVAVGIILMTIILRANIDPHPSLIHTDFDAYMQQQHVTHLNSSHTPRSPLIVGNPMQTSQCRNAILDAEHIDIHSLLKTHLPKIYNLPSNDPRIARMIDFLEKRRIPQLWGREQLNALQHDVEWWSGARVHVSFDPFWYFELEKTPPFSQKHLQTQLDTVKRLGDSKQRERASLDPEQLHFLKTQNASTRPTRYSANVIHLAGYNNTHAAHASLPQVAYYHIPKCASSSTKRMLHRVGGTRLNWRQSLFDGYVSPGVLGDANPIECGFTFVRHPIHRFISAYYTLNLMLKVDARKMGHNNLELMRTRLTHLQFADECYFNFSCFERVRTFIDALSSESWRWINNYKDLLSQRVMEHVGSMAGHFLASYDGWALHYVGRVEHFAAHWRMLSANVSACSDGYLDRYWRDERAAAADATDREMGDAGVFYRMKRAGQGGKHTLNRTLVDAYYALAMDRSLFEKLVKYYRQDFVCFDYDATWQAFLRFVLEHDPTFRPRELRPSKLDERHRL